MKKILFSMFAIVGLAMATYLSLSMLTACDDDDDDDDLTEIVDDDGDDSETTGTINGYEYVDLGLSVKWATVNIGATLPADYGNYYAWGETETKDEYTEDNSVTYGDSSIEDFAGNTSYDAATANWGSSWRMPTEAECQELVEDCTWTWSTQNNSDGEDINGYLVEGTNGNFIFLPAAGYCLGSSPDYDGARGYYWSSSPEASIYAYHLYFYNGNHYVDYHQRYNGRLVRPVSE